MSDLNKEELIEKLAALEHRQWAGWIKYLFARGRMHIDNRFTIDSKWVEQWSRQLETDYKDLPEDEKNRARTEAQKVLELLGFGGDEWYDGIPPRSGWYWFQVNGGKPEVGEFELFDCWDAGMRWNLYLTGTEEPLRPEDVASLKWRKAR